MSETFYVTTPIYYINDVPHLGSAYSTIAADVLCRYKKLRGYDGYFLTGTDEHGLKIQRAAEEQGLSAQALADDVSEKFRAAWPQLGCAPNDFIRTSSERHKRGVQKMWTTIADAGDIYLGHYEGLYCVGCEAYYTDKELEQPGGLCPIHRKPAEQVKEESYFFRLSKYGDRLLDYYRKNPAFVQPQGRMNEVMRFVESGLQDLSVSRTTFNWGVPVPGDEKHVMYVWFDALANYWTALVNGNVDYWPATVHVVGKDILRFHAVYWPAFLMAAGFSDDQLPRKVLAHGFLTYGGQKMSKSLRNTIGPVQLAGAVSPSVGVDTVRYCLMRSISFGHDGDFSIDDVVNRYATDLGNTLGNLLNRLMPFAPPQLKQGVRGELENDIRKAMEKAATNSAEAFDACSPTRALEAIWAGLAAANVYVDKAAPWTARKESSDRLDSIVTTLAEVLESASVLIAPVMPSVSARMRSQLGLEAINTTPGTDQWPFRLPEREEGSRLAPGEPLFPRIDKKRALELQAEFSAPTSAEDAASAGAESADADEDTAPGKPTIGFDDFMKIELKVGLVVEAMKAPRKDRLLKLKIDTGEAEPRDLIAGVADHYAPEELVGKRVVVLTNLAPKKFGRGLVSQGMVLAADDGEQVKVVTVDGDLPPGSTVR